MDSIWLQPKEKSVTKRRRVSVDEKTCSDRLPDWASEGAVLAEFLEQTGILEQIGKRLRVQREGGYVGVDILLFLVFFFTSSLRISIKEFGRRTKQHRQQLAALGGRKRFPTPPSVSRFFGAVERQDIQEFGPWLLFEGTGAHDVLQHPSTIHRDAVGNGWHFFDWDPTTTALRQRSLPVINGLPNGKRRAEEMKPGYAGRKRGDVQMSRATLQHAGSGLWLGIWLAPGNGEPKQAFDAAVQTIGSVCQRIEFPTDNAVIRSDGQGGNIPYMTACKAAKIHYVTRWGKYGLLEQSEIREHLNQTTWFEVPDSGSGPRRQAAELGWFTLPASRHTRQPDGSRYAPVRSRLVVSRFRTDKKRGAGVLIDGWEYELFATDLDSHPWPAPELVTTYYGRSGQENRFGQEDRELELDRVFSYHVLGQELANLIGLFVWNLQICRGMSLIRPPCELPPQKDRVPVDIDELVELDVSTSTANQDSRPTLEREVSVAGQEPLTSAGEEQPALAEEGKSDVSLKVLKQRQVSEFFAQQVRSDEKMNVGRLDAAQRREPTHANRYAATVPTGTHDDTDNPSTTFVTTNQQLFAELNRLPWPILLQGKPNWCWDPERGLLCPDGVAIRLTSVKRFPRDHWRHLRFKAPYHTCPDCTQKSGCTSSESSHYCKEAIFSVPAHVAAPIEALLQRSRRALPSSAMGKNNDVQAQSMIDDSQSDSQASEATKGQPATEQEERPPNKPNASPGKDLAPDQRQRKPRKSSSHMQQILPTWKNPSDCNNAQSAFSIASPILIPSELRRLFHHRCLEVETYVTVYTPSPATPVRVFALTPRERQRRRLSWDQRHQWNQLPDDAEITIRFAGGFTI